MKKLNAKQLLNIVSTYKITKDLVWVISILNVYGYQDSLKMIENCDLKLLEIAFEKENKNFKNEEYKRIFYEVVLEVGNIVNDLKSNRLDDSKLYESFSRDILRLIEKVINNLKKKVLKS